jgi:hypothetical protein
LYVLGDLDLSKMDLEKILVSMNLCNQVKSISDETSLMDTLIRILKG